MDVGDQRTSMPCARRRRLISPMALASVDGRRGDAHDLAADLDQAHRLRQGGLDVLGAGRGHRLHADRAVAADGDSADLDFARLAALRTRSGSPVGSEAKSIVS